MQFTEMSCVGIIPRVLGATDIAERQEGRQGRAPATFFQKKKMQQQAHCLPATLAAAKDGRCKSTGPSDQQVPTFLDPDSMT